MTNEDKVGLLKRAGWRRYSRAHAGTNVIHWEHQNFRFAAGMCRSFTPDKAWEVFLKQLTTLAEGTK